MPDTTNFLGWFEHFSLLVHSGGFQFFGLLFITYLALLWLALIIWVTRDAIQRGVHLVFQLGAILLNIFLPILGLIIYLILRPQKTLLEKYHEDWEYRLLEGGGDLCFACETPIHTEFSFCPKCGEELGHPCGNCKKSFSRRWSICPFCGKEKNAKLKMKNAK